jgi:hypothetical protein
MEKLHEANDQAATKADEAERTGRREPLETRLRVSRRKGYPATPGGISRVCGRHGRTEGSMTRGDLIVSYEVAPVWWRVKLWSMSLFHLLH